MPIPLLSGGLQYEGPRERRLVSAEEADVEADQQPQPEDEAGEDKDFLEDVVSAPG